MNIWGSFGLYVRGHGLDFAATSQALELQPTRIVHKGPRTIGDRVSLLGEIPLDGWFYVRRYDETVVDVSTVLLTLLKDLRPRAEALQTLRMRPEVTGADLDASFQSRYGHMCFELPREVIQGLHELGSGLGIDVLSFGDPPDGVAPLASGGSDEANSGMPDDNEAAPSWDMTGSFVLSVRGEGADFGQPFDLEGITAMVGLPPTHTVVDGVDSNGDSRPDGWFHERPFTLNSIAYRWDTDKIVNALTGLLKDLGPHASSIRALNRRPDVTSFTIECRLRSRSGQIGFDLPIQAIDQLYAFDVGLTFDVISGGMAWNEDDDDDTE